MAAHVIFYPPGAETPALHSEDDFGLLLTARPEIEEAEPVTYFVEIPGRSGAIDLSRALTGRMQYKDRALRFAFSFKAATAAWEAIATAVRRALLGERRRVVYSEDDGYYYDAMITGVALTNEKKRPDLKIEATAAPYKYERWTSAEDWLWDPFDFDNMNVREYGHIEIPAGGAVTLEIIGSPCPSRPVFFAVSGEMLYLTVDGVTLGPLTPEGQTLTTLVVGEEGATVTLANHDATAGAVAAVAYRAGTL